ncbi:MAG: hypothetical protein ABII82_15575 [Verrucomicrobiota bacterium]
MKLSSLLVVSLLLLGSGPMLNAQTQTQAPTPPRTPAADVAEEVPMGAITGQPIARDDGRWFGLTMVGPKLQLNFYDQNKQPEPADRIRGVVRIDPPGRNEERDVMNPVGDGTALITNRPVRAPWVFKVIITLIDADQEAAETLVVHFNRSEADAMTAQAQAEVAAAATTPAK